jgi:hypothetical protein
LRQGPQQVEACRDRACQKIPVQPTGKGELEIGARAKDVSVSHINLSETKLPKSVVIVPVRLFLSSRLQNKTAFVSDRQRQESFDSQLGQCRDQADLDGDCAGDVVREQTQLRQLTQAPDFARNGACEIRERNLPVMKRSSAFSRGERENAQSRHVSIETINASDVHAFSSGGVQHGTLLRCAT